MNARVAGYGPIGSNAGFIFGSHAFGSILRVAYAAVLARKLGPELFGLFSYGLGWCAAFLAVANLQLESYMSREVARRPDKACDVLSQAMTMRVVSTAITFVIAVAIGLTTADNALVGKVLFICAVAMAGRSAAMWCNSAFIARENAREVFRVEAIFRILEVLAGVSLLMMGFGLIAVLTVHALSWSFQALYGFWSVRSRLSGVRVQFRLQEQLALLRSVLPIAVASVSATWLMQGPFVMYKGIASVPGDLGVVALVLQTFILTAGIPVALGRAALPALSRTVVRTDKREAVFLSAVLRSGIAGATALIVLASATGEWAIPLVFGDAYRPAGAHLTWGMIMVLPFGVGTIASQVLIAHGRSWPAMASAALGAASMTVLVHELVARGGPIDAYFLCISTGMLVWAGAALALLSRCVVINWWQCLAKPASAGALSLASFQIATSVFGPVGGVLAAAVVLVAGQRIFGVVDRHEQDVMSRVILARLRLGASRE